MLHPCTFGTWHSPQGEALPGRNSCFPEPYLLVNCMGSHFLNHLQGEPNGSFLPFCPPLLPSLPSCKQGRASYLPPSVSREH